MKVLVTGSAGFIGKAVARELAARGHELKPFDYPLDVRRRGDLDIAAAGCGGVINLAGILGSAENIGRERESVKVNILGALNVYEMAADRGIPVVQIATGHKGQPNPYAITKAAAEDLALARVAYGGQRITVVRAYHAYGPGQKACPPHGTSPVRKIIPSFVCRALTGMDIEINGDGKQLIDLVHVEEVARVLADALDGPYGFVVEAGTGIATSALQAARDVITATGSSSRIVHLPMRAGEPEGDTVVAAAPACHQAWPHGLDATVDHYRDVVA